MKKVAIVLAGCGHKDGAEITEAVSSIIELSRLGCELHFFAPNREFAVHDPITNKPTGEKRNLMLEAARITRGKIQDLALLEASDFSALAFPGGSGVAYNLCNWAQKASECQLIPEVTSAIQSFYQARKPIGAICIAPVLLAKSLGQDHVQVTIGDDPETAAEIEKTGAKHQKYGVTEACVDFEHRLVTTPAYMYGQAKPHEVFKGISTWAEKLVKLMN